MRHGYCRDCGDKEIQELNDSFRCGPCADKRVRALLLDSDAPTASERYELAARDRRAS